MRPAKKKTIKHIRSASTRRSGSQATQAILFTSLSASRHSALMAAKAAMSERYLRRTPSAVLGVRGFRAMAASAADAVASNVVGVGIDEKFTDGVPTGVHVVKFLVKTKQPKNALSSAEMLPPFVNGIPTDVEEVGLIVPLAKKRGASMAAAGTPAPPIASAMPNPRTKQVPARPGCSVGFADPSSAFVMAGSFGALVKDSAGQYVLSNNHVLANESGMTAAGAKRVGLPIGSPIFQPGLLDGGNPAMDEIAELSRYADLRADKMDNKVDAAIAKVIASASVSRDILFIGPPNGVAHAAKDMIVHKFGRTTSYRAGRNQQRAVRHHHQL